MKLKMSMEMGVSAIVLTSASKYTLDGDSAMIGRGLGTRTATFEENPGVIQWNIDFLEGVGLVFVQFTWGNTDGMVTVTPPEKQDDFAVDLTYDAATETMSAYLHYKS